MSTSKQRIIDQPSQLGQLDRNQRSLYSIIQSSRQLNPCCEQNPQVEGNTNEKSNTSKRTNTTGTSTIEYKYVQNETLFSKTTEYHVIDYIGKGSYGKVIKCRKKDTNEIVAVKVLKNNPYYINLGQAEIRILARLNQANGSRYNIVQLHEYFAYKNHICLVFDFLQETLHDFRKRQQLCRLPLAHIRPILQQTLTALVLLKRLGIIHTDIKPDNIMLVHYMQQSFRVKLIDFGNTLCSQIIQPNVYVQTRWYRSPEIILGLPYNEKIDIWSLALVMVEMFLSTPLYPGLSIYDQVCYIIQTQGFPSNQMLNNAAVARRFFNKEIRNNCYFWQLKSPQQYRAEIGIKTVENRIYKFNSLDDIIETHMPIDLTEKQLKTEKLDRYEFMNLIKQMLALDQNHRTSAEDALKYPFICLTHLVNDYHADYETVNASIRIMNTCCGMKYNIPAQESPRNKKDQGQHVTKLQSADNAGPSTEN